MKRFVDIRSQGTGYRFCWFSTNTAMIETHNGTTVWDTFAEFEQDYKGTEIERYRSLTPEWAFHDDPNDKLWNDDEDEVVPQVETK